MTKSLYSLKALALCLLMMISQGCGKQVENLPVINGVKGPYFNLMNGKVVMTMKFLNLQMDAGFGAKVPKTQNSTFELGPNVEDGGMILQLYLDPEDIRKIDVGVGDGNTLPDGRPLPGVPGGKLENSLRIDTDWHDISFYYHKKLFGLWIPVGFETAGLSGSWNLTMNNKRVGLIGLVGNDEAQNLSAGGIIFLNLDTLKDKQVQKLIKHSRNHPENLY